MQGLLTSTLMPKNTLPVFLNLYKIHGSLFGKQIPSSAPYYTVVIAIQYIVIN